MLLDTGDRLLPARMLNAFAYCPRLFHLEHVDGLFADNEDTVEGRSVHRAVDEKEDLLPDPPDTAGGDEPLVTARSVTLSSTALQLIAKIDLLEAEGGVATPVDTKKGKAPDVPEGAYEPERVQLCAQGLLLREHGYAAEHGALYYAGSRKRVRVDFDEALVRRTLELTAQALAAAEQENPPPPLADSPKCPRCSLVGICLPDEVNLLRAEDEGQQTEPRRLVPAWDDAVAVYVVGRAFASARAGRRSPPARRAGPSRTCGSRTSPTLRCSAPTRSRPRPCRPSARQRCP